MPCDGATTGQVVQGHTMTLQSSPDIVYNVGHYVKDQTSAIDGGRMDGFYLETWCGATESPPYPCYSQYAPAQVPNLISAASNFAVSDRFFEDAPIPSWGSHLDLVAQNLDGFTGDNPPNKTGSGPGWGCDSDKDAPWQSAPGAAVQMEPSCIPYYRLSSTRYPYGGAYRATPVRHVPTLMDRMRAAGVSWRFYEAGPYKGQATGVSGGYGWAICPTFADCIYTAQRKTMTAVSNFSSDASTGNLPQVSFVTPAAADSEHNLYSMTMGDDWLGSLLSAIENGPDWSSTAVFLVYDDCGCFYDHVPPPNAQLGIRVPFVAISPYAKQGYTDSTVASFASIDAFIERNFGLSPLSAQDRNAYDLSGMFDYSQVPLLPVHTVMRPVPEWETRYLAAHPAPPDQT
jgi:phospholipase C